MSNEAPDVEVNVNVDESETTNEAPEQPDTDGADTSAEV